MICDMNRPEGMSRPVGTAMQNEPGTDVICDMNRPEDMSRLKGAAMQTTPGTDMIYEMIRPRRHEPPYGHGHADHSGQGHEPTRVESCRAAQRYLASAVSLRATWASFSSRLRALQPKRRKRYGAPCSSNAQDTLPCRPQVFG
jgi:hypothetical protein